MDKRLINAAVVACAFGIDSLVRATTLVGLYKIDWEPEYFQARDTLLYGGSIPELRQTRIIEDRVARVCQDCRLTAEETEEVNRRVFG